MAALNDPEVGLSPADAERVPLMRALTAARASVSDLASRLASTQAEAALQRARAEHLEATLRASHSPSKGGSSSSSSSSSSSGGSNQALLSVTLEKLAEAQRQATARAVREDRARHGLAEAQKEVAAAKGELEMLKREVAALRESGNHTLAASIASSASAAAAAVAAAASSSRSATRPTTPTRRDGGSTSDPTAAATAAAAAAAVDATSANSEAFRSALEAVRESHAVALGAARADYEAKAAASREEARVAAVRLGVEVGALAGAVRESAAARAALEETLEALKSTVAMEREAVAAATPGSSTYATLPPAGAVAAVRGAA